jgi:ABC-type Mn2+/Zn2+ transport system permease subunit
LLGIFASYWFDLPTGPTIVAFLALGFAASYVRGRLRA